MLPLQANWQADRGGAAVVRSGVDWLRHLQGHNRHRVNSKLHKRRTGDNLAALGKIIRIRRQVMLADGRCGRINAQLEVEIAFGNKRLTMSLLILPRVVGSFVVGIKLSNTSRNRDKVCWTRNNSTSQVPTYWMARVIGGSCGTDKRGK